MTEKMTMYPGQVNSPYATIVNGINAVTTLITVDDASILLTSGSLPYLASIGPSTGFDSTTETVLVTNIAGNVLTITRGVQGTAIPWVSGSIIAVLFTEFHLRALNTNVGILLDETPKSGLLLNPVINGNFDMWDYGTTYTGQGGPGKHTCNRFGYYTNSGINGTTSKETSVLPSNGRSTAALKVVQQGAANTFFDVDTNLEGKEAAKLLGNVNVNLQIQANTTAGVVAMNLYALYPSVEDNFTTTELVALVTRSLPTVYGIVEFPFTLPAVSPVNSYPLKNGLRLILRTYQNGSTGTATVYYSQIQLNSGQNAIPFQPFSYNDELLKNSRYHQEMQVRTINGSFWLPFRTRMRAAPTVTSASGTASFSNITVDGCTVTNTTAETITVKADSEMS